MFIYKMPNYPGFYRKSYSVKTLNLVKLYNTNTTSRQVSTTGEESSNRVIFQNPCEYFMFSVLITIWFGGYVRRILYNLSKKIYK